MIRPISRVFLISLVLVLVCGGTAIAERRAGSFSLSPMVGYHVIDGSMDLEDSPSFGLGFGYNYTPEWAVEADVRFSPVDIEGTSTRNINLWTFSLGALYHFQPEQALNPYLSFGGGLMQYDFERELSDDEDVYGYYGAGLKYALTDSTDFRLDLRHILDYRSDNRGDVHDGSDFKHHLQAMLGLSYNFGGTTAAVTPKPAPEVVAETAPVDSDNDGVLDPVDQCPGTGPGVRVDSVGCPADTDGDGVADYLDACLDTPRGTEVDAHGCPKAAEEVASLTLHILFGIDRDQVTPFHADELKRAAAFIQKYPMYRVVVEGHTDDQGSAAYNQELSQRRAESVRRALVNDYGFPAGQVTAIGYGETDPVAANNTPEGRSMNRRVVISIRP